MSVHHAGAISDGLRHGSKIAAKQMAKWRWDKVAAAAAATGVAPSGAGGAAVTTSGSTVSTVAAGAAAVSTAALAGWFVVGAAAGAGVAYGAVCSYKKLKAKKEA